jgi:hypothetical protein
MNIKTRKTIKTIKTVKTQLKRGRKNYAMLIESRVQRTANCFAIAIHGPTWKACMLHEGCWVHRGGVGLSCIRLGLPCIRVGLACIRVGLSCIRLGLPCIGLPPPKLAGTDQFRRRALRAERSAHEALAQPTHLPPTRDDQPVL